ncbi:MAG: YqgE/AlgH family protein [Ginsengibacter sp.]
MISTSKGVLLIANPFLKDPNFSRSVVLLCENLPEGTFGFVLNKLMPQKLNELIADLQGIDFPVYNGGPVQIDSLHFLHQYPDLILGGEDLGDGVFWGGNFESLKIHLKNGDLDLDKLKFFVGYSGWMAGQLNFEMKEESWVTVMATRRLIFTTPPEEIWKESLKELGGEYERMINYPIDPRLN